MLFERWKNLYPVSTASNRRAKPKRRGGNESMRRGGGAPLFIGGRGRWHLLGVSPVILGKP
jgi:hypothetical protein